MKLKLDKRKWDKMKRPIVILWFVSCTETHTLSLIRNLGQKTCLSSKIFKVLSVGEIFPNFTKSYKVNNELFLLTKTDVEIEIISWESNGMMGYAEKKTKSHHERKILQKRRFMISYYRIPDH